MSTFLPRLVFLKEEDFKREAAARNTRLSPGVTAAVRSK
jgi:hypothetical protein